MKNEKLKMQKFDSKFKTIKLLVFSLFTVYLPALLAGCLLFTSSARADELEDLARQIAELENAKQQSVNATKPLEAELSKLDEKLSSIQQGLEQAAVHLKNLEKSIIEREKAFETQYGILAERVEAYYKRLRGPSFFFFLISTDKASQLTKELSYRQAVADEDKAVIAKISKDLVQLEKDKEKVEKDREMLAVLQKRVDEQAKFFRKEVKGAKEYQAKLTQQIAALSARQQSLISQRQSSLNLPTSLGAGPLYCTDDRKLDPGFSPAFAFYTYGIPHRVGLNQYGAYGRAKANQNYQQILQAYFANISFEKRGNINLKVQGYGEVALEQYLLGIYEMPGDWPMEALKAQAIAARSYALAYTNNGAGEICTTQACQVYKGGNKGGAWEQAVKATEGEVMVSGGEMVKAWYSSTDGGYTFTSGDVWGSNKPWTKRSRDTTGDVNSFAELNEKAFDKDSPCFYSAQGFRNEYAKSAWLKSSEAADIVNALMLAKADESVGEHLYQTDKPHPYGGEIWNEERVKQELGSKGITPFNNVSNISVSADFNSGQTTNVSVSGDAGGKSFSAQEFKNYFNLRAPANIQIVGPLFNIEKK